MAAFTQGAESNLSGEFLERAIEQEFHKRGVKVFTFKDNQNNGDLFADRFLLRHVPYTSIYGAQSRSEFVYRDFRLETDIRIECRYQETPGSVDEKLPYLFLNAVETMPEREIWLVVEGGGARKNAIDWLKCECSRCAAKTIRVLTLPEARMRIKHLVK